MEEIGLSSSSNATNTSCCSGWGMFKGGNASPYARSRVVEVGLFVDVLRSRVHRATT